MSFLRRFVPTPYRSGEAVGIVDALGTLFDEVRVFVDRLPSYLTPSGMPAAWLPWMAASLGLPDDLDLSEYRTRAAIRIAIKTWVNKGPIPSIREYVQALTGIDAEVETVDPKPFICGTSFPRLSGDPASTDSLVGVDEVGIDGWNFVVRVPTGSITEAELRRLLSPVVPVFCSYTVEFL